MQLQNTEKLAYSMREFCAAVSLSRSRVYELIEEGLLSPAKCGRKVLIPVDEAQRFVASLERTGAQ